MFVTELFDPKNDPGYRTEKDDNTVQRMSDTRKSRLTLAQIKRLRIMNDLRKFEHQKEVESLAKQYKPAAEAGGMPPL